MFRDLMPQLADRYHVIAPDHLGFGLSDAPPAADFDHTFDALTDLTAGLLGQLGVSRYAIYVHDFGAPIGWRLALRDPTAITAIVSQNGNGYDAGFVDSFWKKVWDYQRQQTPETEAAIRFVLTLEATDAVEIKHADGTSARGRRQHIRELYRFGHAATVAHSRRATRVEFASSEPSQSAQGPERVVPRPRLTRGATSVT